MALWEGLFLRAMLVSGKVFFSISNNQCVWRQLVGPLLSHIGDEDTSLEVEGLRYLGHSQGLSFFEFSWSSMFIQNIEPTRS